MHASRRPRSNLVPLSLICLKNVLHQFELIHRFRGFLMFVNGVRSANCSGLLCSESDRFQQETQAETRKLGQKTWKPTTKVQATTTSSSQGSKLGKIFVTYY